MPLPFLRRGTACCARRTCLATYPPSASCKRARRLNYAVIPSEVRACVPCACLRGAGTRSRGISLRCTSQLRSVPRRTSSRSFRISCQLRERAKQKNRATRFYPCRPLSIESRSFRFPTQLSRRRLGFTRAIPCKSSQEALTCCSLTIATRCYPRRTLECTAKLFACACLQRPLGFTRVAVNSAAKLLRDPTHRKLARFYPRRPFASSPGASFTAQFSGGCSVLPSPPLLN